MFDLVNGLMANFSLYQSRIRASLPVLNEGWYETPIPYAEGNLSCLSCRDERAYFTRKQAKLVSPYQLAVSFRESPSLRSRVPGCLYDY